MSTSNRYNAVDHIDDFIVLIHAYDETNTETNIGTGFFIGPGWILTCAHVVLLGEDKGSKAYKIQVSWNGETDNSAELIHCTHSPFPDLALLLVKWKDNNSLILGKDPKVSTAQSERYFLKGFPNGQPADPSSLTFEGPKNLYLDQKGNWLLEPTSREPQAYVLKFKDSLIEKGMSGGPILDKITGKLCGMIRANRSDDFPLGGYGIPVSFIIKELEKIDKDIFDLEVKPGVSSINPLERLYEIFNQKCIRPDHCDQLHDILDKLKENIANSKVSSTDIHRIKSMIPKLKSSLKRMRDICLDQSTDITCEKNSLMQQIIDDLKIIKNIFIKYPNLICLIF